jgi:Fuc2NAc and GlcNAc transferase
VLVCGPLLIAYAITGWFRRYALGKHIVDVPNLRSSHVNPTPRGAGVAIALATLGSFPVLVSLGVLSWQDACGLCGGGSLVALIGFADDRRHIAARWRLLGQFVAATWLLAWLKLDISSVVVQSTHIASWISGVIGVVYLVWLLNLTNFMDGIDGIAGVEVVSVCLSAAVLYRLVVPQSTQWLLPVTIASATLGFLIWNWPPARIFMGDVGSGYLGIMLASSSLIAVRLAPRLFWCWVILLGVFVVDATLTLLRRIVRGQKFYEAHRSHAYQRASRRLGAHLPVTLSVAAINIGWLLPLAVLVALRRLGGEVGVFIAYAPLALFANWLGAGNERDTAKLSE